MERLDLHPARLIGDTAYGSAEMLNWLVHEHGIEPHVPVFDKSKRTDNPFSREDFAYDHESDTYLRISTEPGPCGILAYSANYLIDVDNAIILDVEATTAIRQAETLAARRMVERTLEHFDLYPERLIGDSA